jgi:TolA-binding protein
VFNWQAVVALTGVLFFCCGTLFGAIKWLIDKNIQQLQERFEKLNLNIERVETRLQDRQEEMAHKMDQREQRLDRLKENFADFRLDVEREKVDHDDWVRVEGGQNIMLQRISDQISGLAVEIGSQEAVADQGTPFPDSAQP